MKREEQADDSWNEDRRAEEIEPLDFLNEGELVWLVSEPQVGVSRTIHNLAPRLKMKIVGATG